MVDGTLEDNEAEDVEGTKARIPDDLLTRILHEFFQQEDTRMSKAANRAVGKYFEIFVQEAIARTAQEKDGRFLEVKFPVFLFWGFLAFPPSPLSSSLP